MENVKNYYTEQELIAMGVTPIRLTDEQRQKSMRSEEWKAIRPLVFERDNWKSRKSGLSIVAAEAKPSVHHEVYLFHEDGTEFEYGEYADHLDCLVSVTAREHMAIHGKVYEYTLDLDYETTDEIIGHVYRSYDYEQFHFHSYNREVDHYMGVLKLMVKYGAIPRVAYCVRDNGKLYVIDGQNSFKAREQKGLPIIYVVIKAGGSDIAQLLLSLNLGSRNFSSKQRAESFAKQGKEAYAIYNELKATFPYFPDAVYKQVCTFHQSPTTRGVMEKFNNGDFEVENYELAVRIMTFLQGLKDCPKIPPVYKKTNFIASVIFFLKTEQIELDALLKKFCAAATGNAKLLEDSHIVKNTVPQFKLLIQEIMNWREKTNHTYHTT